MRNKLALLMFPALLAGIMLCGGCRLIGIAVSPGYHERKIPAEYLLSEHSKEKILIFVESTITSKSNPQVEGEIYVRLAAGCKKLCKFKKDNIITFNSRDDLKSMADNNTQMTPVEIAEKAGADLVLYVLIENYDLYEVGPEQYYEGAMATRTILFNATNGELLWPRKQGGEVVKVAVDLESRGMKHVNARLFTTTSHCILRKLYDCPVASYKTEAEDRELNLLRW